MIEDHIENYLRELENVKDDSVIELNILKGHTMIGSKIGNMKRGSEIYSVRYIIRKSNKSTYTSNISIIKKDLEEWVSNNAIAFREERLKKLINK